MKEKTFLTMGKEKKMKRAVSLVFALLVLLSLSACGVEEQNITMNYGETTRVELKKGNDGIEWVVDDNSIAIISDGNVEAVGPGKTTITAIKDGKNVAIIALEVNLIDISSIFLAQKEIELDIEGEYEQKYTLLPDNASNYGLSWKSTNEEIATVSSDGVIRGIAPGSTTIIISSSSGAMETCEVVVKKPSAIEQLNEKEKILFKFMTESMLSDFYNASAVRIRNIYDIGTTNDLISLILDIQGTNRVGGTLTKKYGVVYNLRTEAGLYLEAGDNPDLSHPMDSSKFDPAKLNAALEEYWETNHY